MKGLEAAHSGYLELYRLSRRFLLRRVAFPENPPAEWFVIDLLEHADQAASSPAEVATALARALPLGRFDGERLREMARRYRRRRARLLAAVHRREGLLGDAHALGALSQRLHEMLAQGQIVRVPMPEDPAFMQGRDERWDGVRSALKEEVVWLRDWNTAAELREAIVAWLVKYHTGRAHQSLGWMTPTEYRKAKLQAPAACAA